MSYQSVCYSCDSQKEMKSKTNSIFLRIDDHGIVASFALSKKEAEELGKLLLKEAINIRETNHNEDD